MVHRRPALLVSVALTLLLWAVAPSRAQQPPRPGVGSDLLDRELSFVELTRAVARITGETFVIPRRRELRVTIMADAPLREADWRAAYEATIGSDGLRLERRGPHLVVDGSTWCGPTLQVHDRVTFIHRTRLAASEEAARLQALLKGAWAESYGPRTVILTGERHAILNALGASP